MAKTTRINISLDEDLLKRIDAEAEKLGMKRSEFIRLSTEEKLSDSAANDGIDTTLRLIRRVMQDEFTGQFNRMAKMIAKDTKASATAMYMLLAYLSKVPGLDAIEAYRQSESRAVTYLTTKE